MPVAQMHIDRISLPRSLVGRRMIRTYTATFRFQIGELVAWGVAPAIILERSRSAMGREIYNIVTFDRERPFRTVQGKLLFKIRHEFQPPRGQHDA
jgi:hypothetical protein